MSLACALPLVYGIFWLRKRLRAGLPEPPSTQAGFYMMCVLQEFCMNFTGFCKGATRKGESREVALLPKPKREMHHDNMELCACVCSFVCLFVWLFLCVCLFVFA